MKNLTESKLVVKTNKQEKAKNNILLLEGK